MSGGSFNYLCFAMPSDLFEKRGDLKDMVDELSGRGYIDAAQETETISLILDHFQVLMQARLDRLCDVWQAVEWHVSGDYSKDQVETEIAKYRADILP